MKIETFQKIQQKFTDFIVLPISIITTIWLFFWQNLFDNYFIIWASMFVLSLTCLLYSITINLLDKPFSYLFKTYQDNKRYRSVHKINIKIPEQETKNNIQENAQNNLIQAKQSASSDSIKKQNLQNQLDLASESTITQSQSDLEVPQQLLFTKSKRSNYEPHIKIQQPKSNICDMEMLFKKPSSKKYKAQQRIQQLNQQSQEQRRQIKKKLYEKQQLVEHLKSIRDQDNPQKQRLEYQQKYQNYKKTVNNFCLDKQMMQNLVYQTKKIVKQKLQENIKIQLDNLQKIENLVRRNFVINFRSFKARSININQRNYNFSHNIARNIRDQFDSQAIMNNQNGVSQRSSSNFYQISTGKQISFDEMLKECCNLINCDFFDFQYSGQPLKQNEVKKQFKSLILQRFQLDKYFILKNPLVLGKGKHLKQQKNKTKTDDLYQERYLNIVKLQNLASILGERTNIQQNLLKQFFSTSQSHSHFNNKQKKEGINDKKNIDLLIVFMTKIFNDKIKQVDNEDQIKVQLSPPNFQDKKSNHIWIKKEIGSKTHYNIIYSLKQQKNKKPYEQKKQNQVQENKMMGRKTIMNKQQVYCVPGQNNVWTCILFVRLIISKIGLNQVPYLNVIKDKKLRKDLTRLVELLK